MENNSPIDESVTTNDTATNDTEKNNTAANETDSQDNNAHEIGINIEEESEKLEKKNIDVKEILNKVSTFIKEGKYLLPIFIGLASITTIAMVLLIIKTTFDVKNLNARSNELYNLKSYNTSILNTNSYTKAKISDFRDINDVIEYNISIKQEDEGFEKYLQDIQAPYDNFLQYIFLPSLNIWKDPFLGDIDYSIIGEKYLEKNPYDDIALLDKWSNFIKDVGTNNEYNDVSSIEIGDIVEEGEYFYIPLRISYTAPSYRGFLLLVEKLSTTSNRKNISLINELIYNIREKIKEKKAGEVLRIQEEYDFSQDKAIGYSLYQRVIGDSDYTLIDDEIIDETIREVAICQNDSVEYCYYKFRDKYRNLPSIAYTIGLDGSGNKTEMLRDFLKDLPQIIKVINFTYEGNGEEVKDMVNYSKKQYKGSIELRVYGDGLHENEITEIQQLLGEKCLGKDLTPDAALSEIDSRLANIGNDRNIDTYSANMLMELQTLISDIANSFAGLSNYKKAVKTFEIYRMLNEGNICNI